MSKLVLSDLEVQIIQAMRAAKTTESVQIGHMRRIKPTVQQVVAAPAPKTWASKKDLKANLGFPCTHASAKCSESNLRTPASGEFHFEDAIVTGVNAEGRPTYDRKWHYSK